MSTPMTPVLSSLSESQRASVEAVEAPVTFPRAQERYPLGMYRFYERDCKPMMRAWLLRELAEWFALCPPVRSTALADHRDALIVAKQLAAEEIRRPLNTNEIRLLGEAVRDILTAKLVLPASAEQQREREIL